MRLMINAIAVLVAVLGLLIRLSSSYTEFEVNAIFCLTSLVVVNAIGINMIVDTIQKSKER